MRRSTDYRCSYVQGDWVGYRTGCYWINSYNVNNITSRVRFLLYLPLSPDTCAQFINQAYGEDEGSAYACYCSAWDGCNKQWRGFDGNGM